MLDVRCQVAGKNDVQYRILCTAEICYVFMPGLVYILFAC